MRTELYQWMKSLAFFHVLTTALLHILPDKRYEQYIRLFMGLLLVLLICTPIFAVVGKSEELLSGFSNNYGREEQVRMKTEAEGIRETFLKGSGSGYPQERRGFFGKNRSRYGERASADHNTLWNSHRKTEGGGEK